jgi:putative sterol carrier protein
MSVRCLAKFPSEEWGALLVEALNSSKNFEEAAKDWEGDFLFTVEPENTASESSALYVDLWHGKCRGVEFLKSNVGKNAAFTISGTYENWKGLLKKEIDPVQGFMTGKIKLKGDVGKLMQNIRFAEELIETTSKVPTEFS